MELILDTSNRVNIVCKMGDSFVFQMKFWADQQKTIPIDITTMVFLMVARGQFVGGGTLVFDMTITAPNVLTVSKPPQMINFFGNGFYDLQKELLDGTISTVINGSLSIEKNVAA